MAQPPRIVIAYQNKAAIYSLLLKAAADTLVTIAADPKHLGARVRCQISACVIVTVVPAVGSGMGYAAE